MKTLSWIAALLLIGACGLAFAESASVQGEVLDMACYMGHEAHGAAHAKCAKQCLLGGMPAGLLKADGSVVLLVEDHGKPGAEKAYKSLAKLAGDQVTVTGELVSRGGISAIVVQSVKKG